MSRSIVIGGAVVIGLAHAAAAVSQEATLPTLRLLTAVRAAIETHADVRVQVQEVARADALKAQAAARFASAYEATADIDRIYSLPSPAAGLALAPTSTSNLAGSIVRPLRNGITLTGTLELQTRTGDQVGRASGTAHAAVGMTVPLLRSRSRAVNTATETAAEIEREATVYDLRQVTAQVVTDVVTSYWDLVAAERSLAVKSASSERGRLLLESMQALVDADQLPRSDLAPAAANLADRRAALIAAVQARVDARSRLLIASGMPAGDVPDGTALLDEFPGLGALPAEADVARHVDALVSTALAQRADHAAAQARVRGVRALHAAAVNGLLPEVNLNLQLGISGAGHRNVLGSYLSAFGVLAGGPDLVGQITIRGPVQNTLARGRLAELDARLQQAQLALAEVARQIAVTVAAAYRAWRSAYVLVENARQSVQEFELALQGERDKLTLGLGSVVNVLTIEDRLTAASEREVAAWKNFGVAVINLRFATGTLVPARTGAPVVDAAALTTVPEPLR